MVSSEMSQIALYVAGLSMGLLFAGWLQDLHNLEDGDGRLAPLLTLGGFIMAMVAAVLAWRAAP